MNVRTIATDLTYGLPPPVNPAPPANVGPVTTEPLGAVVRGGDDGERPRRQPPQAPADPCPTAPPTVFPPAAPSEISGRPAEGSYRWRVEGSQEVTGIGSIGLPPFVQRTVIDSRRVGAGPGFTVEERELVFGSQFNVRTTYEYREGSIDTVLEGQNVDVTGLYLVKIERMHRVNRDANSEFNPSPPILVLPLPVAIGASVNSTGIDPISLEVMRQTGSVTKRERVDACGEPMDAYFVETIQEFVSASGRADRRKFHYGISTNMGGLPIVEHIESPCVETDQGGCSADARTFLMSGHIGQLEPDR